MKENYRKYKELMKNPKYKALNQLVLWFMFFGIIYLIVLLGFGSRIPISSTDNNVKEKITLDNYIEMNSFVFSYDFKYQDTIDKELNINGTFIDDKYYFKIDETEYYYDNKLYMVKRDNKKLISNPDIGIADFLFEIDYKTIHNWIKDSSKESETKYKDGMIITDYLYSIDDTKNIMIKISEKDKRINNITLDLVDFLSTNDLRYNKFELYIEYTNVNNIDSIDNNYDEYEIINESV
jgi:hypothetical protein